MRKLIEIPADRNLAMSKSKAKTPKFEDAIEQLESIIDRIESGEAGLETAIAEYEKGMTLIKQCRQILDGAEKRIVKLTEDADGKLRAFRERMP